MQRKGLLVEPSPFLRFSCNVPCSHGMSFWT